MAYRYSLFLFLCCSFLSTLPAQDCRFQLLLEDAGGDGWNGAEVTVRRNGVATAYTLDGRNDDGERQAVYFRVSDGDALEVDLSAGAFPEEISFSLLDNNDSLLYAFAAPAAPATNLFTTTAACVACAAPSANSVELFRQRFNSVDLRFNPTTFGGDSVTYRIRYGTDDFDPAVDGDGTVVQGPGTSYRLNDLAPLTSYAIYIDAICPSDTSDLRGPFRIRTQRRRDVGVTRLAAPFTDCGLGAEDVTIGITNFGGEPQAFFNVNFSVDGGEALAMQPADGIYTGVVGVDSTEFFTFDARAFLTGPGEHTITAWTELAEDERTSNDTATFVINNIPFIRSFPYRQDFDDDNGFWFSERAGRGPNSWMYGSLSGPIRNTIGSSLTGWATNLNGDYNNRERSYLYSPCFDLREFDEDPVFSALLYVETEENFDAVWVETSTDQGNSWQKLEVSPRDFNWYNDRANQVWTGDGGTGSRLAPVSNLLTGLAGEADVRLRFVFQSDGDNTAFGVALDRVIIQERAELDLSVDRLFLPGAECDLDELGSLTPLDTFFVEISNPGIREIQEVSFEIRWIEAGENELTLTFDNVTNLQLGQQQTARIALPRRGRMTTTMGRFQQFPLEITGRVIDPVGESVLANNTAVLRDYGYQQLPTEELFTAPVSPRLWEISDNATVEGGALRSTFSANGDTLSLRTAAYGLVRTTDSLTFDLRFTDVVADTSLTGLTGDLLVGLQMGCEDSITLNGETIVPFMLDTLEYLDDSITAGTFAYALEDFEDEIIRVVVQVRRTGGDDALVAFDNFSIRSACTGDLDLSVNILAPSDSLATDGAATVIPDGGVGPYTFDWSNGATRPDQNELGVGDYVVAVTDAFGCTDTIRFNLDLFTGVDETGDLAELAVFPNPTTGLLTLQLGRTDARDLQATVFDLAGRQLLARDFGNRVGLSEQVDLGALPAGTYLLRLTSAGGARTVRVVKR